MENISFNHPSLLSSGHLTPPVAAAAAETADLRAKCAELERRVEAQRESGQWQSQSQSQSQTHKSRSQSPADSNLPIHDPFSTTRTLLKLCLRENQRYFLLVFTQRMFEANTGFIHFDYFARISLIAPSAQSWRHSRGRRQGQARRRTDGGTAGRVRGAGRGGQGTGTLLIRCSSIMSKPP